VKRTGEVEVDFASSHAEQELVSFLAAPSLVLHAARATEREVWIRRDLLRACDSTAASASPSSGSTVTWIRGWEAPMAESVPPDWYTTLETDASAPAGDP